MRSLAVAGAIAIAAMLVILNANPARAQNCNGDIAKLAATCRDSVMKPGPQTDPSNTCCLAVQSVNVPCVCDNIPKDIENIISMEKVVYVAKYCGKALKRGSKC